MLIALDMDKQFDFSFNFLFLKAMYLMESLGVRRICRLMEKYAYLEYIDACGIIIQRLFNALARMNREKEIKPDPEICEGKLIH